MFTVPYPNKPGVLSLLDFASGLTSKVAKKKKVAKVTFSSVWDCSFFFHLLKQRELLEEGLSP